MPRIAAGEQVHRQPHQHHREAVPSADAEVQRRLRDPCARRAAGGCACASSPRRYRLSYHWLSAPAAPAPSAMHRIAVKPSTGMDMAGRGEQPAQPGEDDQPSSRRGLQSARKSRQSAGSPSSGCVVDRRRWRRGWPSRPFRRGFPVVRRHEPRSPVRVASPPRHASKTPSRRFSTSWCRSMTRSVVARCRRSAAAARTGGRAAGEDSVHSSVVAPSTPRIGGRLLAGRDQRPDDVDEEEHHAGRHDIDSRCVANVFHFS